MFKNYPYNNRSVSYKIAVVIISLFSNDTLYNTIHEYANFSLIKIENVFMHL